MRLLQLALAYSADAVYLYSTRDPPEDKPISQSSIISPNKRRRLDSFSCHSKCSSDGVDTVTPNGSTLEDLDGSTDISFHLRREENANLTDVEGREEELQIADSLQLPVVYPRRKFVGACNVETVKDGEYHLVR